MIQGVVALPGQGKTILLARWAASEIGKRPVAANFRLAGTEYLPSFVDILDWCASHPNGALFIDEAGVVLNARNWARIPQEIQFLFAQHRHFGIDVFWAAQRWDQVDRSLRELTLYVTLIEKFFPGWPPSGIDRQLPDGTWEKAGYWLVPIFRAHTYRNQGARFSRRPEWTEWFLYRSRWAEMFRVSEIVGVDESRDEDLASAYRRWQQRDAEGHALRIR